MSSYDTIKIFSGSRFFSLKYPSMCGKYGEYGTESLMNELEKRFNEPL